jgi:diguanylate cyclase (GGDEF)-like protein/PAS domain S-box-containing protein
VAHGPGFDWVESIPLAAAVLADGVVVAMNDAAGALVPGARLDVPLAEWFDAAGTDTDTDPDPDPDHEAVVAVTDGAGGIRGWVELHAGEVDAAGHQVVLLRDATDEQFTAHALDGVAGSTFVLDGAGRPRWRSEKLRRRSGLDEAAAAQQNPSERIHPEDLPVVLDTFVDAKPDRPSRAVVRSRSVDDDDRWETIEVVVHQRLDHEVLRGYLVQVHNLDDGVRLETGLDRDDGGFLSLTEAAPVGIAVTDIVGEIVYRNRAARELLGPDIQWLGRNSRWLDLARPEHRPALLDAFDAALRRDESATVTAAFDHGAGGERWLRLVASPQRSAAGHPRGLIATIEDVTEQVESRAQLETAHALLRHLAEHDPLTSLPNRSNLMARLHATVDRHRADPQGIAVLFCDLDGFKPINDRHGHGAGDAVLAEVAVRLRAAAEPEALVARVGGDEFVVLREGPVDDAALVALAERLHDHLRPPFVVEGTPAALAVSIGIATLAPGGDASPEDLLRLADQAMYEAKAAGVGRTVVRAAG